MSCATCTRRTLLTAVGATGLLAACGGGDDEAAPSATSAPDDPVITELAELREQGAVLFDTDGGKAIAIARGQEVVAVSAVCTHEACTVAWDENEEQLACPCHGSRFAPDGSVVNGPAMRPLAKVEVVVDEAAGVLKRA